MRRPTVKLGRTGTDFPLGRTPPCKAGACCAGSPRGYAPQIASLVRFSATPTIRKLYCRIRSTISDSDIGGRVRRRNGPDSPRALRSIQTRAVNINILMALRMRLGLCRLNLHASVCRERFESQQWQIWALRLTGRAARRPACAISPGPPAGPTDKRVDSKCGFPFRTSG